MKAPNSATPPGMISSHHMALYMMLIVDSFSGSAKGYFLADKQASTTLEALKQNIALSERQMGQKIKCIRTDEGTEFCNSSWHDFLTSHGIVHETTSAHSSASNGVVECAHRTIIECVCVLLHETGLPASMWCEVASMIIYLSRFVPNVRNPSATPFELWHNTKPDISHLRPFGCTAYAKIPVESGGGLSKLEL